jgi:hypothetical protein
VAMGVPSISVFAATRILRVTGAPAVAAARPVITSLAILCWTFATALIPLLAMLTALTGLTTVRRLFSGHWPRYRPEAWTVVFPLGMYAMASLELGTAAEVPLIQGIWGSRRVARHRGLGAGRHHHGRVAVPPSPDGRGQ